MIALSAYRSAISLAPYPRPELFATEAEMDAACDALLKFLQRERGVIAAYSQSFQRKRERLRAYMNERAPLPVPVEMLALQDRLLYTETMLREPLDPSAGKRAKHDIFLWEGDIRRLAVDAVVNAANGKLLGCFLAGHHCIDNVIHSAAGMQVRADCAKIIALQGEDEACGGAKVTSAYNLPSRYILHTVGPFVAREVTDEQRACLRSCYTACLNLCEELGAESVAFCCVSTGVFNFPHAEAAELAAGAVVNWKLRHPQSRLRVIFNTFLPQDTAIYSNILSML